MTRPRNPALEAAIVAAPDDLTARAVYSDWLQEHDDPIGAWAAMRAGLEARPDDHALRAAIVAYHREHVVELFGDDVTLPALEALFADPIVQFVRHIAIAQLDVPIADVIAALVEAKLPLLEDLVVFDAYNTSGEPVVLDAIAALPLRRLTLHHATVAARMPALRELVVRGDVPIESWLREACPALESIVHITTGTKFEVAGVAVTRLPEAMYGTTELKGHPLETQLREGDRAFLRRIPGLQRALVGIAYEISDDALPEATKILEVAVTLPEPLAHTVAIHNLMAMYQKVEDLVRIELVAHEGLLVHPGHESFYSVLVDALLRQRRFDDVFAMAPQIRAAIEKPQDTIDGGSDAQSCLLNLMLVYLVAGKHDGAIELYGAFPTTVDDRHHAALAIGYLQLRKKAKANAAWKKVAEKVETEEGVVHHARALFAIAADDRPAAKKAIAAARRGNYSDADMAWLAEDPRLAELIAPARKPRKRKPRPR